MKKAIIIAICIVNAALVFAQKQEICFSWSKVNIPIYANELTDSVIFNVYQDFDAEDYIYEVFVIEKSPLRFKVEYRDLYNHSEAFKIGWVDKKYCSVWDRWYYDESLQSYIKLYKNPNVNSDFIKIYKRPFQALTVVDYEGKFLKVMFDIDDIIYIGWIDRYCRNIFNSCT